MQDMSLRFICLDVDGVLLTTIPDGRVAMVEIIQEQQQPPPELGAVASAEKSRKIVKVTPLDGESYYEPSTETTEHLVDVQTPTGAMLFHVSVSGRDVKRAKRLI